MYTQKYRNKISQSADIKPKLRVRKYKRIIERFGMIPNSGKSLIPFFI